MVPVKNEELGRWSLQGVEPSEDTFSDMTEKLSSFKSFCFSRWGDGEFNAILGNNEKPRNCDGHEYFADMGRWLKTILLSRPSYIMGIQPLCLTSRRAFEIQALIDPLRIDWVNADAIHNASIDGRLGELLEVLKRRNVTLVGPQHLNSLATIQEWKQITIPNQNCWLERQSIASHIARSFAPGMVYLLCASMMSEIIIDVFSDQNEATFIDCGSVFDPYAGVKSRRYHQKLKL